MRIGMVLLGLSCVMLPASAALAQLDIDWQTMDAGGSVNATGGTYRLSGTIGQPDASPAAAAGSFRLSGGFWLAEETGTSSTDSGADSAALPATPALQMVGSYPNPFHGSTTIRFALGARQGTRLSVYDTQGRLYRRIDAGVLPAGQHELIWDGRDAAGRPAPAGTYFLSLTAKGHAEGAKAIKLD